MTIKYYKETQAEKLSEELKIFEKDQNIKTIMILACDANNFTSSSVDSILKNIKKPVFGGIFPGLIFNLNNS